MGCVCGELLHSCPQILCLCAPPPPHTPVDNNTSLLHTVILRITELMYSKSTLWKKSTTSINIITRWQPARNLQKTEWFGKATITPHKIPVSFLWGSRISYIHSPEMWLLQPSRPRFQRAGCFLPPSHQEKCKLKEILPQSKVYIRNRNTFFPFSIPNTAQIMMP